MRVLIIHCNRQWFTFVVQIILTDYCSKKCCKIGINGISYSTADTAEFFHPFPCNALVHLLSDSYNLEIR